MKRDRISVQENLFGLSKSEKLRQRVKELDELIKRALKKYEYHRAKELTEQQEKIIQELVDLGEKKGKS